MTNKGAIDILRIILREATECENSISYVTDIDAEPLRLAIKALEKQIPKKPTNNIWTHYRCPVCMKLVNSRYCGTCGQRLDWSDEDEA